MAELPSAEALAWARSGEFAPTAVDERDKGTPDEWIARHPALVRLTGARARAAPRSFAPLCASQRACPLHCAAHARCTSAPLRFACARRRTLQRQRCALHRRAQAIRLRWRSRHVLPAGRHPFNCEPPLTQLMAAGFVTPAALHSVRNHGAAPRLDWNTHTITFNGAPWLCGIA